MKKLIFIASVGLLFSCNNRPPDDVIWPKDTSKQFTYKVGETLIFNDLEIMSEDLDDMLWINATEACKKLGEGWRLPTQDELLLIYQNKEKIGGFHFGDNTYWDAQQSNNYSASYWSSTEDVSNDHDWAWSISFNVGSKSCSGKNGASYVRAVRNNKRN